MGTWGSDNFRKGIGNPDLVTIIEDFPSKLKQAMYAASQKRNIRRGTWNGCAFNQAGLEELKDSQAVTSTVAAASSFGISQAIAAKFIQVWDNLPGSDEDCTIFLRECIEKAGLFTEPGDKDPRIIKRIVRNKVYEAKMKEQFDTLVEHDLVELTDEAEQLLCGAGV